MIYMLSENGLDKTTSLSVGEGALYSIVSILMVFAILLIIIGVTSLVFKLLDMFEKRKAKDDVVKSENIDTDDDDEMAAILAATIEYRNETKKDVKVKSVKRIK